MHQFTSIMFSLLVITGLQVSVQTGEKRSEPNLDRPYKSELTVTNGGGWGFWGEVDMCPDGTYAAGFSLKEHEAECRRQCGVYLQEHLEDWRKAYSFSFSNGLGSVLKVEAPVGQADDTALNGIRLYCVGSGNLTDSYPSYCKVQSDVASWGQWTDITWCPSALLTAFQLSVEPPQGNADDTAANNIMFRCSNGVSQLGNGTDLGDWGDWSDTCEGTGICGLRTLVELPQGNGDDTALNDVIMYCCD
ncbi:vitelline membrane outer layer protein 1 homolog [Carassius auratus]|uniref:Vitelline membrane outer layer protein 1 homolog n=1 Tax=Carassius auratus TaxID=7957 RepID=A0A6P6NM14_CARAU|nr:vitelline membrane outer layer protein 1 homolog [Carassius auratus]